MDISRKFFWCITLNDTECGQIIRAEEIELNQENNQLEFYNPIEDCTSFIRFNDKLDFEYYCLCNQID